MQQHPEAIAAARAQARAQAEEAIQNARAQARAAAEEVRASITEARAAQRGSELGGLTQLRDNLLAQLKMAELRRDDVAKQLTDQAVTGQNRVGLTQRLGEIDAQVSQLTAQLNDVNAGIVRMSTQMQSGSLLPAAPPARTRDVNPERFVAFGVLFAFCVLFPLAVAYARRVWRRGSETVAAIPRDVIDRLSRIDQNLDAVALEVERIGESQRYLTRTQAEQQRGVAGAQPEVVPAEREKDWHRR